MKFSWRPLAIRLLVPLVLGFFIAGCKGGASIAPGSTPPGDEISLLSGSRTSFKSLEGKVVLVNFWASWCDSCVEEMPSLEKLQREFGKDLVVLAVGVDDTPENLNSFALDHSLSMALGLDRDGQLKRMFRVTGLPESFILNKQGRFVMFNDPADNFPVVRIIGPRQWDNPSILAQFRSLVNS